MDDMIILQIPSDKYKFIKKTISEQKDFLFKIKMHPLVKQEALKGLRIIDSIITNAKRG